MNEELPMTIPDRWTVEPVFHWQSKSATESGLPKTVKFYALMFGDKVQKKATFERDIEGLRDMAKFLNSRKMEPRPRVQCLADTNIAPLPKRKGSTVDNTGIS